MATNHARNAANTSDMSDYETAGAQDLPFDVTKRPKAPPIPDVTPEQSQRGGHLAMIHRLHLHDLQRLRGVIDRIEDGEEATTELAEGVSGLKMHDNMRRFGTLCGRECAALTFHHDAEESMVFPHLSAHGSEGLRKVVEQLMEEHRHVHALLIELDANAVTLCEKPGSETFSALKGTFEKLHRLVVSHFGYEETELRDALGYHGIV